MIKTKTIGWITILIWALAIFMEILTFQTNSMRLIISMIVVIILIATNMKLIEGIEIMAKVNKFLRRKLNEEKIKNNRK